MRDIAMHINDISQNSISAEASSIKITIAIETAKNLLQMIVADNGKGIEASVLKQITDPFVSTRTTRKIGLGLALLQQNVNQTGGKLEIESQIGVGTKVSAIFIYNHIDCPPLGDLAANIALLLCGNEKINWIIEIVQDGKNYTISSIDIKEALGDVSLSNPPIVRMLKELLNENISEILK